MFKNISFLYLLLLLASSCGNSENKDEISEEKTEVNAAISEMSIYNLPSKWTTQNDENIELKDLRGKTLVMVMIYTSCQAACPRLVADMRNIEKQIPDSKKPNIQYVFVSIDPAVDTLKDYRISQ